MIETDVLGEPYTCETIDLADDDEGPVTARLVYRAGPRPSRGAVLHLHGFCDYFFQTVEADFFVAEGYDFYALDLRKYGRSLLDHQTPNFCRDLKEYDAELDAAYDLITNRDGHRVVVVSAHSTGGLIGPLWAESRRARGLPGVDAFVLNSPWLDLQGPFYLRTAGTEAINQLGQRRPYAVVPRTVSGVYFDSIHTSGHGEWDFDTTWKPRESFPVRAGWLRAVRIGHRRVHHGVDSGAPVLTLCASRSFVPQTWTEEAMGADTVLDVKQIAKWTHQLGRDTTVVRLQDALHDVFLSRPAVREQATGHVARWLCYALPDVG